jgi:5-methylcytosine-specific restriction endonuclease McrA
MKGAAPLDPGQIAFLEGIAQYALPNSGDDREARQACDFRPRDLTTWVTPPDAVKNFHRHRLPQATCRWSTAVACAYCRKPIQKFSSEREHIVPAGMYIRYRLMNRSDDDWSSDSSVRRGREREREDPNERRERERDRSPRRSGSDAGEAGTKEPSRDLVDRFYEDPSNIVLVCLKCNNASETKQLPSSEVAERLAAAYETYMRELGQQGSNVPGKLRKAATRSRDIRRQRGDMELFYDGRLPLRASPRGARHNALSAHPEFSKMQAIDAAVRRILGGGGSGRANLRISFAHLAPQQKIMSDVDFAGRMCFYCLGLFSDECFTLDHIHPKSGRPSSDAFDASNLLPVCKSCNSSKGASVGLREFACQRIRSRRQDFGLGVETYLENDISALSIVLEKQSELMKIAGDISDRLTVLISSSL